MDTHTFQNTNIEKNERISVKNLKFKGDILTREEKVLHSTITHREPRPPPRPRKPLSQKKQIGMLLSELI
jgi:hypothetical protein